MKTTLHNPLLLIFGAVMMTMKQNRSETAALKGRRCLCDLQEQLFHLTSTDLGLQLHDVRLLQHTTDDTLGTNNQETFQKFTI